MDFRIKRKKRISLEKVLNHSSVRKRSERSPQERRDNEHNTAPSLLLLPTLSIFHLIHQMHTELLHRLFIHSQHLDIPPIRERRRGESGRGSEEDGVGEGVAELDRSRLSGKGRGSRSGEV